MTQQYQEESINGQPAPLALNLVAPTAPAVPGGINTEAIFWPSAVAEAAIVGDGIAVAGNAALGTIIEFSAPGVYQVNWTTALAGVPSGAPLNILLGALSPITAARYPSIDWIGAPSPGIIALSGEPWGSFPPGPPNFLTAQFRITDPALIDTGGVVNPLRQMFFSAAAADIPVVFGPVTRIDIQRVSK